MTQEEFIVLWRYQCTEEAIYSRSHGYFDRATRYDAIATTYDGTRNSSWYDFHALGREEQKDSDQCDTSS